MAASLLYSSFSPSILRLFCNARPQLFLNKIVPSESSSISLRRHRKPNSHSYSNGAVWRRRPLHCLSESTYTSIEPPPPALIKSDDDDDDDEITKIKQVANTLDLRVGKIIKAWIHEEAESLYVEEVDVGETEPRIICSGLVQYVPLQHLQDSLVVVLANLKPRNMRGIKSYGMLMAASDESHKNVELLLPPEGSVPGERIWFGSENENGIEEDLPDVASPNQIQKKKIWEQVQPHLKTDASRAAFLGPYAMRTSKGAVFCKSLENTKIS